ncbi:MAG: hypothetical protein DRJ40_07815 [Thermoprotei archaeon]|nr:MAG: hypothetical protein DRJ40_07815 [Thermoprotei archaeon]
MIIRLEVENWRSYIRASATFTEGITFVHGVNGAGKTSLLEAIAYALYGSRWLRLARREGEERLSDLQRRGSSITKVRLWFRAPSGEVYVVQRCIVGGRSQRDSTYLMDSRGRRLAIGDEEVTEAIERITGISCRAFRELLYVRQGELKDILKERRREKLDELLRIKDLEKAKDSMRDVISKLDTALRLTIQELSQVEHLIREYENRVLDISKKMDGLVKLIEEYRTRVSSIESRLEEMKKREEELRSYRERIQNLRLEVANLRTVRERYISEIRVLEGELQRVKELRDEVERLARELQRASELEQRLRSLREQEKQLLNLLGEYTYLLNQVKEYEKLLSEVNRLRDEYEKCSQELRLLESERSKLLQQLSLIRKFEEEYSELLKRRAQLEQELSILRNFVDNLEGSRVATCPLCEREISSEYRELILKRKRKRIEELKNTLTDLSKRIQEIEQSLKQRDELLSRLLNVEQCIASARSRLQELESKLRELSDLQKQVQSMYEKIKTLEGKLSELERIRDDITQLEREAGRVQELRERLSSLMQELSRERVLEQKIAELRERVSEVTELIECKEREVKSLLTKFNEEEYTNLQSSIQHLEEELVRSKSELSRLEGELKSYHEQLSEAKRKLSELEKRREELIRKRQNLERVLAVASLIRRSYDEIKPMLRSLVIEAINMEAENLFNQLKHKKNYESIEISPDYEVYIRDRSGAKYLIDYCSEGEKTLIALVLRYALAKVLIGETPILILDEPTEHLDREHRARLIRWLSTCEWARQLIVTSHIDEFSQVANNVVEVRVREDGVSEVIQ